MSNMDDGNLSLDSHIAPEDVVLERELYSVLGCKLNDNSRL